MFTSSLGDIVAGSLYRINHLHKCINNYFTLDLDKYGTYFGGITLCTLAQYNMTSIEATDTDILPVNSYNSDNKYYYKHMYHIAQQLTGFYQ